MDTRSSRTIAIIQARMGSTRLPGKVLKPLVGKPVLWHVVSRLSYCTTLDQVVVATTTEQEDDVLEQWCRQHAVGYFRGDAEDVLDRYYQTAREFSSKTIVRITSDCPVVDPAIVDEVVQGFSAGDYHVYGLAGEFPDGLDCEVIGYPALEVAWKQARLASEREHVTPFYYNHPGRFRIGQWEKFRGLGHHRWTLDEEADLIFLQTIFMRLYREGSLFLTQDILDLLNREPELMECNRGILRNEGYLRSVEHDHRIPKRGRYGHPIATVS